MQFVGHSSSNIFGNRLKRYAEEKLQRPILRHQLDGTDVSVRAEAEENGSSVDFKVSVFIPGKEAIVVTATEDQLNAAIDIAADKLERSLRSLKNRLTPGKLLINIWRIIPKISVMTTILLMVKKKCCVKWMRLMTS